MPRFVPFPAVHYATSELDSVIAPPYDVLSEQDIDDLAARDAANIVHVDVPRERDGDGRYVQAGDLLRQWISDGIMVRDDEPSFTLYRMSFVDATGRARSIAGVLGGVEVEEYGVGGVLPHERITPKASTDRLDLTRATRSNMSPVWGLSLAGGLTELLQEPGELMGEVVVDGVAHRIERVIDPERIAAISAAVGSDDVLIADGHHRYGVAQKYRAEVRESTGATDTAAEETLLFVSELVADQLSVEAIHRVYRGISRDELLEALATAFDMEPSGPVTKATLAEMDDRGSLCLAWPDGEGLWLTPKAGAFDGVRSLDGVWLEHVLDGTSADVDYQHGVTELHALMSSDPSITAAVLIRPVSVEEIERTAREGVVMPPKSTFFTPKLRTGLVIRPLD